MPQNNENSALIVSEEQELDKSQTKPFKRFDSVLDIHDYETDFDDLNSSLKGRIVPTMPELSKWEREDQGFLSAAEKDAKSEHSMTLHGKEKVTTEVLRKAENAIFTRAINAIRPTESQRSSTINTANTNTTSEASKQLNTAEKLSTGKRENAKELLRSAAIKTFQITVPASSQERSVEIKSDNSNNVNANNNKRKSNSPKQVRSVKERLGRKVTNTGKDDVSPLMPDREVVTQKRSHSIERNFARNDSRDKKRRVEPTQNRFRERNSNNRQHDANNAEKKPHIPSRLGRESERGREREREREKDVKAFDQRPGSVSERRERGLDERQVKSKEESKSSTDKTEKKIENTAEVLTKKETAKVTEKSTSRRNSRSRESRSRSSSADDDDDTDSDEAKHKRKRRNKKDKKRSKRSSSEESVDSEKRKHLKSKKRNKSERKKKKSKK